MIRTFCDHYGIQYDFLSDEGSTVIRRLGILNTLVQPDEAVYGIPYPGTYVLDASGTVVAKFFNREYQVRESAPFLLSAALGIQLEPLDSPRMQTGPAVEAPVRINARLATPDLKFRQRTELVVELEVAPGFHLYADPIPDGFFATEVTIEAPEAVSANPPSYPPPHVFQIEGLDEQFFVYDGTVRITVELDSRLREGLPVPIEIEVRYQACSDTECYLPSSARLQLDIPIGSLARSAEPPARG